MEDIRFINKNVENKNRDIYRILQYFDYLVIEPKKETYNFCVFFFSGFNENSGKYLYLFLNFFEKFSKLYKIYFKIYLPMLDIYARDKYPSSYMINYDDDRQYKLYSWFNYIIHENKRVDFVTQKDKDKLIKDIIDREKNILGCLDKFIFIGFSMGGRYLIHVLEKHKIKTKFNLIFKSPIFMFKSRSREINIDKSCSKEDIEFFKNKFYVIYSKNDKFCNFQDGLKSYYLLKTVFNNTNLYIDNGTKHIVDYNCIELLRKTLVKELGLNPIYKF